MDLRAEPVVVTLPAVEACGQTEKEDVEQDQGP